jgi:hypothetical protein
MFLLIARAKTQGPKTALVAVELERWLILRMIKVTIRHWPDLDDDDG